MNIAQPRPVQECSRAKVEAKTGTGRTIMELLRAVAFQSDRAVVVVTHDRRVFGFGDRIASLEDGRITSAKGQTPAYETPLAGAAPGAQRDSELNALEFNLYA